MNTATATKAGVSAQEAVGPRLYAGQYLGPGAPRQAPADYTVLLPADGEWPRDVLLRAVVADALQRNGRIVDEDTLEATIEAAARPGAPLRGLAPTWRLHPGETSDDGRAAPPFHGYAVALPAAVQRTLLDSAARWSVARDAQPPAPVDAQIAQLKALAAGENESDVVRTLEAIDAAIQAGQAARAAGQPVDAAAVRAMVEFATRMGKEREAARILERYCAVSGVAQDAKTVGQDAARVFNGRDPVTGKPLGTEQRVDAAFALLSGGFRLAGELGATAQLLGVGGRWASSLIGIAPAGVAIIGFAAGAYQLVKKVREAVLRPQWDEFRWRFPQAQDMEPKQFVRGAMRQIAGMPTDPANAESTLSRIIDLLGGDARTRERFLAVLRRGVEPDALVDDYAMGEHLDPAQLSLLAQAARESSRAFLELELDDSKRYARDRDGERTRGSYLLEGELRAQAGRDANAVGATVDEALRVGALLSSGAHALHGMYRELLGKLRGAEPVAGLDDRQQRNLAGATVAAARQAGLSRVDHVLPSEDGRRLFAVQGDPRAETRRMVAIDIAAATRQGLEASSRVATTVGQAASAREPAVARLAETDVGLRGP